MKKILSLILVSVFFTCVACGKTEPVITNSTTETQSTAENKTEGVSEKESTAKTETDETANKENSTTEKNETTQNTENTTKSSEATTKRPEATTKKPEVTTKKPETTTRKPETTTMPSVSVVKESDLIAITEGFHRLVNEERARVGVHKLTSNSFLKQAATIRSKEITSKFSHTRPDGTSCFTAIPDSYAYATVGENIQYTAHLGSRPYDNSDFFVGRPDQIEEAYTTIFNNFKNSPGHYANMINENFYETGIAITYVISPTGMAIFYVVEMFGTSQ